jgi:hypothetical protein
MAGGDIIVAGGRGEANENRPLEIEGPVGSNAGAKGLPEARPPTIARIAEMRGHDKPTERQGGVSGSGVVLSLFRHLVRPRL